MVVNGGSALGEEDFNAKLIEGRGQVVHHYIAAVPGRPLMMAVVDGKPVVNLPGPVMAAYFGSEWCLQAVTARILASPCAGIRPHGRERMPAKASIPKMANIARVRVTRDDEGYVAHFLDFKAGELPRA